MAHPWKNKTAMVCGASAGLGYHLSAALAGQGARVIMNARDPGRLAAAQAQIVQQVPSAQLFSVIGDMCNLGDSNSIANEIATRFGQLDLVINAVGESDRGSVERLSIERVMELVNRNVGSSLNAIQQFTPLLKQTGGVIALIGSLSSHFAPRYMGGYSIAKHGLAALAQQARLELASEGIHVMLVSPGPIARPDAGQRYKQSPQASDLPATAMQSGGGAKLKGLDPVKLSEAVLAAAVRRAPWLILPCKAILLLVVFALAPRLGEFLLRKLTG